MTTAAGTVPSPEGDASGGSGESPAAVRPLAPPNPRIPLYLPHANAYGGVSRVEPHYPAPPPTPMRDPFAEAAPTLPDPVDPVGALAALRRVLWPW